MKESLTTLHLWNPELRTELQQLINTCGPKLQWLVKNYESVEILAKNFNLVNGWSFLKNSSIFESGPIYICLTQTSLGNYQCTWNIAEDWKYKTIYPPSEFDIAVNLIKKEIYE